MAENGIAWEKLPPELAFSSGTAASADMPAHQEAGAREPIHQAVLEQLGQDGPAQLVEGMPGPGQCTGEMGGELTDLNSTARRKVSTTYLSTPSEY